MLGLYVCHKTFCPHWYGLKGLYFKELKSVIGNTCRIYGPYIFSLIICFCMPCYGGGWESRSILCLFDDFITRVYQSFQYIRTGTLGRTSTKILLSEMKSVLQNLVVGLWRYLSSPISSGIMFENWFFAPKFGSLSPFYYFIYLQVILGSPHFVIHFRYDEATCTIFRSYFCSPYLTRSFLEKEHDFCA